jgi:hypothetical protein
MNYDIFEFTWREDGIKDWVKAPRRKNAIYFIMGKTNLTFGEVIKECNIRKLSIEQQHEHKVSLKDIPSEDDKSFYDYAKEIDGTHYIASTAFY